MTLLRQFRTVQSSPITEELRLSRSQPIVSARNVCLFKRPHLMFTCPPSCSLVSTLNTHLDTNCIPFHSHVRDNDSNPLKEVSARLVSVHSSLQWRKELHIVEGRTRMWRCLRTLFYSTIWRVVLLRVYRHLEEIGFLPL